MPEDVLQLRFRDEDENLTELNAAHVAEVLQGLVGLASDFAKAGAFGEAVPQTIRVRPPSSGSFIIEVVNWIEANSAGIAAGSAFMGVPSLAKILEWSTKSMRAEPSSADHLDNGNVMVRWTDGTVHEIPKAAWYELNKRKRRRKKQLREILAPLSEKAVTSVEVRDDAPSTPSVTPVVVLDRTDYDKVRPEDEVEEKGRIFETEAQMETINFSTTNNWRVKTKEATRNAALEDEEFLGRVDRGLALHKTDIFRLRIREETVIKNGKSRTKWAVLKVLSHREAASQE